MSWEYEPVLSRPPYAPTQDLARAVSYVTEHADQFDVDPEDYALIGIPAGGNLVASMERRNTDGRPGTAKPEPSSWAIPDQYQSLDGSSLLEHMEGTFERALFARSGPTYYFGIRQSKAKGFCVCKWITESFPPNLICSGAMTWLDLWPAITRTRWPRPRRRNISCLYHKYLPAARDRTRIGT